ASKPVPAAAPIGRHGPRSSTPKQVERQPRVPSESNPKGDIDRRLRHDGDSGSPHSRSRAPEFVPDRLDRSCRTPDEARHHDLANAGVQSSETAAERLEIAHPDDAGSRLDFYDQDLAGQVIDGRKPRRVDPRDANGRRSHIADDHEMPSLPLRNDEGWPPSFIVPPLYPPFWVARPSARFPWLQRGTAAGGGH